jgi:TPR repeat protein
MSEETILTIKRRAKKGDALAQSSLATAYALGDGVNSNLEKARFWYEQAAVQGDADSAYNLGAMYLSGEGGKKSKKMAIRWMQKASSLGSSDASVWFGEVALEASNYKAAYRYFSIAIAQGDMRGIRGIAILLSKSNDPDVMKGSKVIKRELKRLGVNMLGI